MNPRLARELDRRGAALVDAVRAIPAGDVRDLSAFIDGKESVALGLENLLQRFREMLAGAPSEFPATPFPAPVKQGGPRIVETLDRKSRSTKY